MADAAKDLPDSKHPPAENPLHADCLFAVPRSKTSKLIVPVGDVDNYMKAIFDLLQKKGYVSDDKWITSTTARKRFLPFGEVGYTLVVLSNDNEEINL
jgi:Holliday junction resolvase RusA-like endonuclease